MSLLSRSACVLPLLFACALPALAKEKPGKPATAALPPVNQCLLGTDRLLPLSLKLDPKKGDRLEIDPGPPGGMPVFTWVKESDVPVVDTSELGDWHGVKIVVAKTTQQDMVCLVGPDDLLRPFCIFPPGDSGISAAEYHLPDPAKPGEDSHVTVETASSYVPPEATSRKCFADFALTTQGPRLRSFTTRDQPGGEGARTVYDDAGKVLRTEKLAPVKKEKSGDDHPAVEAKPGE